MYMLEGQAEPQNRKCTPHGVAELSVFIVVHPIVNDLAVNTCFLMNMVNTFHVSLQYNFEPMVL